MKRFTIFLLWALSMQVSMIMAQSASGSIAGHEYVDLGLSVKWAKCNLNAETPSDPGLYYAWGETCSKSEYWAINCTTEGKTLPDISGNPKYDAARAMMGSSWRIPTKEEFEELQKNCDWKWTTQGEQAGYLVTSKRNGNSIFLPAGGWHYADRFLQWNELGDYWTSTPDDSNNRGAYLLEFNSVFGFTPSLDRNNGRNIRPVSN